MIVPEVWSSIFQPQPMYRWIRWNHLQLFDLHLVGRHCCNTMQFGRDPAAAVTLLRSSPISFTSYNAEGQTILHPENVSTEVLFCIVLNQTVWLPSVIVRKMLNSQHLESKRFRSTFWWGEGEVEKKKKIQPQTTKEKSTLKCQRHQQCLGQIALFLHSIFPWETRFTCCLYSSYLQYQLVTHMNFYSSVCSYMHCREDKSKELANET